MPAGDVTRRAMALAGLVTAGLASPVFARAQDAPSVTTSDAQQGLLTVPVMINDQGPYAFAIDSAANASVIAQDLAVGLGLVDAGRVTMHTVVASEQAPTVRAARLRTGALDVRDARLVVAGRANMDGLDGLLGTDLLAGMRLVLNFRGRTRVNVTRPRRGVERSLDGLRLNARAATTGEQRFNGLLLIDAMARTVPCKVIVDTGAKMTIINSALAVQANAQPLVLPDGSSLTRVLSPTGSGAVAQAMLLPELQLGGVQLTRIPVLVGDFHTFAVWGLSDQPALLLGVDLLGLFQTVTIDLRRGELLLDP
ncbi:MAG: retroviral-like aspartic protease family protein [Brevundimonas sp.]|uniref:aspartyl protease family protein n=1 Tax=Brevundimonas sp. TaxID=1871086 RepID=UPI0027349662|nr:aspartyl protease family protein [Brevundimonas sp.]MDP3657855.1 retroviral-like aspartic protease family protein [Brevundimonas sp.]